MKYENVRLTKKISLQNFGKLGFDIYALTNGKLSEAGKARLLISGAEIIGKKLISENKKKFIRVERQYLITNRCIYSIFSSARGYFLGAVCFTALQESVESALKGFGEVSIAEWYHPELLS